MNKNIFFLFLIEIQWEEVHQISPIIDGSSSNEMTIIKSIKTKQEY